MGSLTHYLLYTTPSMDHIIVHESSPISFFFSLSCLMTIGTPHVDAPPVTVKFTVVTTE